MTAVNINADAPPVEQTGFSVRTLIGILAAAAIYYLATRASWMLFFPGTKVALFFFPHAILISILLIVPTRHWWSYTLAAVSAHFIATQQEDWPLQLALQSEAFDATKAVLTAAGIRWFIKSPFHLISLREAVIFVLVAVIIVPVVTSVLAAALAVSISPEADFWIELRNLGISNAVTAIVLVPVILIGAEHLGNKAFKAEPRRILEASILAVALVTVGWVVFDRVPGGPNASPAILYASVPLLIWAALRFGLGGISAAMLVITILAIWGLARGSGPFLAQGPADNVVALQSFILMAAVSLMLFAVAIDEERRLKEALRVSEQRMSLAAENAQLALWDWDLAKDMVLVQDQGIFGFDPNSPIDHATLGGSVHPDDQAVRDTAIQRALTNGGFYESEFRVILADGSVRWIAARGRSPGLDANGIPTRILGVAIDFTRQKQAGVEAQQQREELAHLSRVAALSALSGSLAHELNQPLTSILGNTHAGLSYMKQDRPDLVEVRAIFEDIENSACRAGEIIERQRTLMRRGEVALQPVSVKESLEELLSLTRSDHIARGVSVMNLATGELPPVMADRVQLQQVLLNLIRNACDAMQSSAQEDRKLTITAYVEQDELRIGVLDTGVGLPDDVESLFEPFHSTKAGGLGMGLSISRSLVSAQRGRLWAERRVERGAAFYVALPLARA